MLTVQLIMESGEQLVMKLPISASIYELKRELQSLLNIQGTLEICTSDVTLADSVLLTEVAGLGNNEQIKPIVSCYEGNNFVCLIRFSLEAEDIELPLVDNSVSDSSIEVEDKSEMEMEPDVTNVQHPPYMNILPEKRPFVVIVSASECAKNFCDLFKGFFGKFLRFGDVRSLDFNDVTPVAEYHGRLYIAADNEETREWVASSVCSIGLYEAAGFIDFLHLTAATVTWPKVETCLLRIFTLLEQQNSGIKTEKWAVVSREYVPPTVTNIRPNEQVYIWMDADSADIIKERFNCLKLCFWTIVFEFRD
ncbi:uncharacterized protein LOC111518978 isoform X1 [Drosophila willistoni]|uniref:uncharacterized protein LOC111518978 isoform X1 n=1 Tax=Drosophila willistoni TaxID=7260 RepID=UPI001F0862B2|nr:uncharacterized protein LOC111518978 isoform X1 [Drosophila willistoni]